MVPGAFSFGVPIFWGAYKHQWLFVIKMGVYIHGVLISCGCLLFQFYGITVLAQEDYRGSTVVLKRL